MNAKSSNDAMLVEMRSSLHVDPNRPGSQRRGIQVTTTHAASVGVTTVVASTDPEPEVSPQQLAPTTRSPTRPPLIPDLYINTLVAFSPAKEGWMTRKTHKYVGAGNAYTVRRVCRIMKRTLFQMQWLDSQYQNHVESLNLSMIQRGNANYRSLHCSATALVRRNPCENNEGETIDIEVDVAALEDCMEEFNPPTDLPTSLAEVEAINSNASIQLHSVRNQQIYSHTQMVLLRRSFGQSSSICLNTLHRPVFFAYIPVSFWQQVVGEANSYARVHGIKLKTCFSLEEIMKFIGVIILEKKDGPRGTSRQGVSVDCNTVAASWYDSSIVTGASNADASTQTTVTRQVRSENVTLNAPTCIRKYSKNMQGVDRLDRTRVRFSLSGGHSFKKCYKSWILSLLTWRGLMHTLLLNSGDDRDYHKTFVAQLSSELISGKWKEAPSERRMFYTDGGGRYMYVTEEVSPSSAVWVAQSRDSENNAVSHQKRCSAVASKQMYSAKYRKRQQCVVCRREDRYATEVTEFWVLHGVCLCQYVSVTTEQFTCVNPTWTCWEK
ncbi:unnamed protein product [Phytophthora fragariaefolia]|uniref:Unnamed protein product n=1 Tax=Phytophthora fragariaefolia TaxID=1490495 RepID=A0A9W7CWK3_9STRA|nr:unnamed protein product [Phytophthora fragariaefolia]